MAAPTYTDWPDGKKHRIPYATHLANMRAKAGTPLTLPAPPVGTYDPSIDYGAKASNTGFGQLSNDAQTRFEQGGQDYGLNLGDLTRSRDWNIEDATRGRDWSLEDIGRGETRLGQDYQTATGDNVRQYGILGRQQAEGAAQRGVTSAGLLGQQRAVRAENQGRDQGRIDLGRDRGMEDFATGRNRANATFDTNVSRTNTNFDQGKTRLDLGHAREFGGFNGQTILNPLTGKPEYGSLITAVTRAGAANTAFQAASGGQRASQAAANGYVSPLLKPMNNGISIGGTPLTGQMYQSGMLVENMIRETAKRTGKSVEEVARGAGIDPRTWQKMS